jgi:hypothetical protein
MPVMRSRDLAQLLKTFAVSREPPNIRTSALGFKRQTRAQKTHTGAVSVLRPLKSTTFDHSPARPLLQLDTPCEAQVDEVDDMRSAMQWHLTLCSLLVTKKLLLADATWPMLRVFELGGLF